MELQLLAGSVGVVAAVPALWWAFSGMTAGKARDNLVTGLPATATVRERVLATSPVERLLGPFAERFAQLARSCTPTSRLEALNQRLVRAGNPRGTDLAGVLAAKTGFGLFGAALGILRLVGKPSVGNLALAAFFAIGAFYVPDALLGISRDRRVGEVRSSAADTIDQLTIMVEAGLGLEAAMARSAASAAGPFSAEISRTLQDIRAGVPRNRALRDMAERVDIPEITQLVSAILQAEKHGVPIATTLRIQASEIRLKRQQYAEEKAMKLQVKIIFPTMLCIMPSLFIVILGPAAVRIMRTFGG